MNGLSKTILGLTAAIVGFGAMAAWADSAAAVDGRWDASLTVNGAIEESVIIASHAASP